MQWHDTLTEIDHGNNVIYNLYYDIFRDRNDLMSNPYSHFKDLDKLFSLQKRVITLVSFILLGIFAWLSIPFKEMVSNSSSQALIRLALILLYMGWFFGLRIEVDIQKSVATSDSEQGRIPRNILIAVPILVLMAFIVLWASKEEGYLSLALGAFLIADFFFYIATARKISQWLQSSESDYKQANDYVGLLQVSIVRDYVQGRWHYVRFLLMAVTISIIILFLYNHNIRDFILSYLRYVAGDLSPEIISPLLPGILILFYVAVFESWQWIMRLRTSLSLRLLDEMSKKYKVFLK